MITYIVAGFALSMDAFAVSVSSGMCIAKLRFRHALRAAFAFGLFQFLMPLAGALIGFRFAGLISDWDHWIAFGLLSLVGSKMLLESRSIKEENACSDDERSKHNIVSLRTLLVLAVATSIDALAVGVSYSLIGAPILLASTIIGVITFAVCLFGCEFGKRLGSRFEKVAEIAGGLMLCGIGLKILLEHLIKT